jgi:hypothetical protein
MRLTPALDALLNSEDDRYGQWSREELEAMNARFAAALEQAFACGAESRESARRQVKLPTNSARFIAPLCPRVLEGLLRSPAADTLVFIAKG